MGVLNVWLEATAPPEPLHDTAGVDGRRARRRGGRGHSGDGGNGERGLEGRLPRERLPLPVLDRATERLVHDGERAAPVLLLLGDIAGRRAEQRVFDWDITSPVPGAAPTVDAEAEARKRFLVDHVVLENARRRESVAMVQARLTDSQGLDLLLDQVILSVESTLPLWISLTATSSPRAFAGAGRGQICGSCGMPLCSSRTALPVPPQRATSSPFLSPTTPHPLSGPRVSPPHHLLFSPAFPPAHPQGFGFR